MDRGKVYLHTYGCRMNACDSEIICSILQDAGYVMVIHPDDADFVILNCCSVREDGHIAAIRKAHEIKERNHLAKLLLCGCYAKLLRRDFFEHQNELDAIISPESYRSLPYALERLVKGESKFIVESDTDDDLYSEIRPTLNASTPNRAIVLGKGCNQRCSYCIEPFTRGSERYVSPSTVMSNLKTLFARDYGGIVTLVGHMVDRYHYGDVSFANILDMVAKECGRHGAWVKYLSSHPMTYSKEIVHTVCNNENIMRVVHLPVQSGSNDVLKRMCRGYTVEEYMQVVDNVRALCPDINIVTDIMVGFCGETDEDFRKSIKLIEDFRPGDINVYAFSMRSNTRAYLTMTDDVPENVKKERLAEARGVAEKLRHEYHSEAIGKQLSFMPGKTEIQDRQEFTDLFNRTHILSVPQQHYMSNVMIKGVMTKENKLITSEV